MNSRKEFEHNMHLLNEKMRKNEFQIDRSNRRTINGIVNARYSPNLRANLNTVDELARTTANFAFMIMQNKRNKFKDDGKE